MQTRKALQKLSKGEVTYSDRATSRLFEQGSRFAEMYDAKEREIVAKKNADSVPMPFLESIKRKVAKMVESPNENLPVVTRFDLHSGIRKMAERAPTDAGLKKLASQLERAWRAEPLGALTYGDVNGLVHLYRDQYPRSKAADAVEAECARVGMHKLPVAKLARIAANIETQADYDSAIEANGYAGDRLEQVRARTLIRELVAMKGAGVDAHVEQSDDRDIGERVANRLSKEAELEKQANFDEALGMLTHVSDETSSLIRYVDQAAMELGADGLDNISTKATGLSQALEQWQGLLTDLRDEAQPMSQEKVDSMQPKPKSAPAEAPAADPEKQQLNQDMSDAGMQKKWYDPRTWKFQSGKLAADVASLAAEVDGELSDRLFRYAKILNATTRRFAQLMPPDALESEEGLLDNETEKSPELNVPKAPAHAPEQELTPEVVQDGADIVQDIQDVAQEVVMEAPPEALSYIEHEMAEGHTAPPGTAQWGAEEILMEGHDAAPPSPEWLAEEIEELAGGDLAGPGPEAKLPPMGAAKGKGIPLPEKVKAQPNAKNALPSVPKDGGKALKAAEIEEALLDGKTVRSASGNVRILINKNDEVELWDRTAGRAADLTDLDIVIADFINMANHEVKTAKAKKVSAIRTVTVVDVPCESCATISKFEFTASRDDQYSCKCGHLIDASTVIDLVNVGALRTAQMAAPPMAPVPGPAAPAAPAPAAPAAPAAQPVLPGTGSEGVSEDTKLPLEEVVKSAFVNYKARGLSFMEAMDTFRKEHKELIETGWSPDADSLVLATATHLYTGTATMTPAPGVSPAPASKEAQKVLEPSVRKRMKDLVSLPSKPLGKDSQGEDLLPSPGRIKQQQGKPNGKLPSTDMGTDSSGHEWSEPSTAKSSPNKAKLPNKDMGSDSEGNDPFPAPSLGKKPSVSKK
jgi:hypothetical protein